MVLGWLLLVSALPFLTLHLNWNWQGAWFVRFLLCGLVSGLATISTLIYLQSRAVEARLDGAEFDIVFAAELIVSTIATAAVTGASCIAASFLDKRSLTTQNPKNTQYADHESLA